MKTSCACGNITKKTEYPYTTSGTLGTATATINYTYDSTWKDKLTSYNGQSISYDAMGNPSTYRGATATWFGRQLQSYTKGSTSVTYKYDENGLRTQKTVNGVVHDYYYVGDQLVYEKSGDSYELFYCYDPDGRLAMVQRVIISSGTTNRFFAITNAQGDVIGLRSTTGAVIARYNYDAFGKLISVTDGNGNALTGNNFATQNGVRYRGYYYDSETGLYYLQSRYYDPETGRFLNADDVKYIGLVDTDISYNAFAYCENEPVNGYDYNGYAETKILGKGWRYRIDNVDPRKGKRHIHVFKKRESYSQNDDGSPHDGSKGSPPNSVKKELKKKSGWDWDQKNNKYQNEQKYKKYVKIYRRNTKIRVGDMVITVGTFYLIYRGVRLLISALPPLWWTFPVNVVCA